MLLLLCGSRCLLLWLQLLRPFHVHLLLLLHHLSWLLLHGTGFRGCALRRCNRRDACCSSFTTCCCCCCSLLWCSIVHDHINIHLSNIATSRYFSPCWCCHGCRCCCTCHIIRCCACCRFTGLATLLQLGSPQLQQLIITITNTSSSNTSSASTRLSSKLLIACPLLHGSYRCCCCLVSIIHRCL